MDISQNPPDPMPEYWGKLEVSLRVLAKRYPLRDIELCAEQLYRKRADAKVVELLKPLLRKFSSVKRILVYFKSDYGAGCYHVFIDVESKSTERAAIGVERRWISVASMSEEFRSEAEMIQFEKTMSLFEEQVKGSRYVVLDRTTI